MGGRKRSLATEQERLRVQGLRILARLIARHYLAHPDLYPEVSVHEGAPECAGLAAQDGAEEEAA